MVLFDGLGGLVFFALWIFCIVDVITTPPDRIRSLPKLIWLIVVVLLIDLGSIAWLVAGRAWGRAQRDGQPAEPTPRGQRGAAPAMSNPDDDEQFIETLRARAQQHRRDQLPPSEAGEPGS